MKNDLKDTLLIPGNIFMVRSGTFYLVINKDVAVRPGGWIQLSIYNNDIQCVNADCSFDIIKVYNVSDANSYSSLLGNLSVAAIKGKCVYDANYLVTLSLQDIANKFNIDVDRLRIKQ